MRNLNKILLAALCGTAISSPSHAQDDGAEAMDDNVIIVTATRRAQDVQDIPLAVTAVSPIEMDRQGVVNVTQISQVSPSFSASSAQTASGTNVLRIRGVGTTSNNIGFESAVGIFIDGAYQSRPGVALSEFVDVDRVEVLRGPQGTLFGRNTSAGALNVTNKRPDLNEFGGFVNATYGNYDHVSLQGAINVPIVQDTLAARVTGAYRRRDGYVSVVDSTGEIGKSNEIDQFLVRGQLGFESDSGVTARLIGDYSKSTANCCAAIEINRSPLETAGLFALVGLGPRGGQVGQSTGLGALEDRVASSNVLPSASLDQWGITGEVKFPLGGNADVIYIGSYREFNANEVVDSDFSALDVLVQGSPEDGTDIKTMTHELRVQGEALGGRLNWLFGGYYSEEKIDQTVTLTLGADYGELIGALLFAPTAGAFGANPLTLLSGGIDPAGTMNRNRFQQDSTSWSIFTHNTLEIADGLELTLGLRYSDESKDGSFTQPMINNALCPGIIAGLGGVPLALQQTVFVTGCLPFIAPADLPQSAVLPLPRTFNEKFSDNELVYTGKVAYEFAAPVNVYASFTHGYKSGGFNLDSTAAAGGADPRFDSETVNSYEVGMKAKLLENAVTLNVALFLEEFSNFQVLEFTGARFQTFNVPKAETKGLEIEMVARPSDHFTLNAGLTYVDANYPSDCTSTADAVRIQNLCGNSLTNAPQIVAITGATYQNDIGNDLDFFLNGQVRMESDRRTSTQPSNPESLTDNAPTPFDVQDGNFKINLRAGIGSQDESWGIEAWVMNLTNEITRGVTFDTTLRSGSRSAFVQQPRTFGVTLRGQF